MKRYTHIYHSPDPIERSGSYYMNGYDNYYIDTLDYAYNAFDHEAVVSQLNPPSPPPITKNKSPEPPPIINTKSPEPPPIPGTNPKLDPNKTTTTPGKTNKTNNNTSTPGGNPATGTGAPAPVVVKDLSPADQAKQYAELSADAAQGIFDKDYWRKLVECCFHDKGSSIVRRTMNENLFINTLMNHHNLSYDQARAVLESVRNNPSVNGSALPSSNPAIMATVKNEILAALMQSPILRINGGAPAAAPDANAAAQGPNGQFMIKSLADAQKYPYLAQMEASQGNPVLRGSMPQNYPLGQNQSMGWGASQWGMQNQWQQPYFPGYQPYPGYQAYNNYYNSYNPWQSMFSGFSGWGNGGNFFSSFLSNLFAPPAVAPRQFERFNPNTGRWDYYA